LRLPAESQARGDDQSLCVASGGPVKLIVNDQEGQTQHVDPGSAGCVDSGCCCIPDGLRISCRGCQRAIVAVGWPAPRLLQVSSLIISITQTYIGENVHTGVWFVYAAHATILPSLPRNHRPFHSRPVPPPAHREDSRGNSQPQTVQLLGGWDFRPAQGCAPGCSVLAWTALPAWCLGLTLHTGFDRVIVLSYSVHIDALAHRHSPLETMHGH